MAGRPKLHGDKDQLIPAPLRDTLLEYIDGPAEVDLDARIAILLGDQAGLRISEIMKLQVADCDLDTAPYQLLIRGAKHRDAANVDEQPIGADLRDALEAHIATISEESVSIGQRYVFGGRTTPYTRQHILALVKAVYKACGFPTIYNVHSLRHGYGTRIYLETKDLMITSRMLRHRSTKPTERYVHMAAQLEEMSKVLAAIAATSSGRRKSPKKSQKKSKQKPSKKVKEKPSKKAKKRSRR